MTRNNPCVAIVGGGVAGLSAAWYLNRFAPHFDVTLFEASPRTGGKIVTHHLDGDRCQPFVLEAGADAFLAKQKPWAYELALELGLGDRLLPTNDTNNSVYVVNKGKLLPLPKGLNLILPTDWDAFAQSPLVSEAGKARMAQEREIPPLDHNDDESIAAFVTRRLGTEAMEKLGEPLLSGIYSAHPEEQSILATFPRFRQMERQYGSLLQAIEAGTQKREEEGRKAQGREDEPMSTFVSFLGGTEELPSALAAQIKTSVHLNRAVQAISRHDDGYSLLVGNETVQADAVVLAIPAQPAAALLRPLVPQAAGVLDELRTVSSGVIYLAYACDQIRHPLDGFGVVIPRIEKRNFNAITWVSSKFAHRVPTGHALIRLFFGGARTPHMMARSDAEIAQASCQELQQLMGIGAMPLFSQIFRWWDAQPQYDVGHLERMERIERSLPPGLALIGTAYQGVGIPDCVYQGRQAARRLVDTILNTLSPL